MKTLSSKETNVYYSSIYYLTFDKGKKIELILYISMSQTKNRGRKDMTEWQRFLATKNKLPSFSPCTRQRVETFPLLPCDWDYAPGWQSLDLERVHLRWYVGSLQEKEPFYQRQTGSHPIQSTRPPQLTHFCTIFQSWCKSLEGSEETAVIPSAPLHSHQHWISKHPTDLTSDSREIVIWKGNEVTPHKRLIKEGLQAIVPMTPLVELTSRWNLSLQVAYQKTSHSTECQVIESLNVFA